MNTRAHSRTYVGRLEAGSQTVYVVDEIGVERLRPPAQGFRWGADAVASELARVMLADALGADPEAETCDRFAAQILARLPQDGFVLQGDTVSAWLRRAVTV